MEVGDLVKVISSDEPFNLRPGEGSVGMIVEIRRPNFDATHYYVYINGIGWRYTKEQLEVISNGSR